MDPSSRAAARRNSLRHARRMSNWTAAALIAGTGTAVVALAHQASQTTAAAPAAVSAAWPDRDIGGRLPAGQALGCDHHRLRRDRDHHHRDGQRQDRRYPGQECPSRRGQLMAAGMARAAAWQHVPVRDDAVAVAERAALGTSARVVVWPPGNLGQACAAVDDVLAALDRQASRFRADSELSWLHAAGGGTFLLSSGLAEAVGVALAAARWTGGLTDPTVGDALVRLGYDRDFADIGEEGELAGAAVPAGWQMVRLDGPLLRLPRGIRLDLGATAKGLGADRAVRAR